MKKLFKSSVSILLIAIMITGLFTIIPNEVNAKVKKDIYRYYQWNERTQKLDEKISWFYDWKSIGKLTDGGVMSGNYIADYSLVQFRQRVTVSGEVNLILMDDTYTCFYSGLRVPEGATLNIFVPDGAVGDGRLIANASKSDYCAGIGSNDRDDDEESGAGNINIHGGRIFATGGSDAAGIGGGNEAHGGHISIYDGYVEAVAGTDAAGIGSGDEYSGSFKGSISIYGGIVKATGGDCGAGIGGGDNVGGIDIKIYGGKVTAYSDYHGAGIGGGEHGDSGSITIRNATVSATGGKDGAAGIGGGYKGTNGEIAIIDSTVNAKNSDKYLSDGVTLVSGQGAAIGSGISRNQGGAITIRNSTVDVQAGCFVDGDGGGAGIGSGQEGNAGTINIYDSKVTAFAICGAGIGGGDGGTGVSHPGGDSGTINIERSTVVAVSSARGAGIGGGDEGDCGTVNITDSTVYAFGGGSQYLPSNLVKPAVTSSVFESTYYFIEVLIFTRSYRGSGIGGGDGGDGGNVTIKNSEVYAQTGDLGKSKAIGRGKGGDSDGSLNLDDDEKVDYGKVEKKDGSYQFTVEGTAPRSGRVSACRDKRCVHIVKCKHENAHYKGTPEGHTIENCSDCGVILGDLATLPHTFGEDKNCTVCGHEGVQITFDTGNFAGTMEPITVGKGLSYQLPDTVPYATESHGARYVVSKWRIEGTEYRIGETYTADHDVTMLALYEQAHDVVIVGSSHGKVTSDIPFGASGKRVTLTATPDDDCYLKQICVKVYDKVIYEQTAPNGGSLGLRHSFTLPEEGNAVVYSAFEQNKYQVTGDASDFNAVMEVRVNGELTDAAAYGDTVSVSVDPQCGAVSINWYEVDENGDPKGEKHPLLLDSEGKASFTMSVKNRIAITASSGHRHNSGTFLPWGTTEWERTHLPGSSAPYSAYYLVSDIVLSTTALPTKNLYICLNGHTVSASDTFDSRLPLIELNGKSLSLYDHDGAGAIDGNGRCRLFDLKNAELEIFGGTLRGGSSSTGSAVNFKLYYNKLIMHGGMITQNTGLTNGVIEATGSGKVILDGGKITDNGAPAALHIGPDIDFQISGSPYISGNHTSIGGKTPRNVLFGGCIPIKITGELFDDALISVHSSNYSDSDGFIARTEGLEGKGSLLNFSCDDSDVGIGTLDGEVVFGQPATVTFDMGSSSDTAMPPQTAARNTDYTLPLCTFSNGIQTRINWRIGNTDTILTSGDTIRITGDITLHTSAGDSHDVSFIEPHVHEWLVELDENDPSKATVRCISTVGGVACNEDEARSVQLTVNGQGGAYTKIYDGKPVTASVYKQRQGQFQRAFPDEDLITVSDVRYYGEDGVILAAPPVNAGIYTAQATVSPTHGDGNAENLSLTIYIGKAQPDITVTGRELYSSTTQELTDTTDVTGMGTIYYRVNGGEWTTETPTASDPGEYTIEWYFVSENYFGLHSESDPGIVHTVILQEHIHDGDAYLHWDSTDSLPAEGNYYLDNDIVLSSDAALRNVNICLNGKTVALNGHSLYIADGVVNLFGHDGGRITGGLKNKSTICVGSSATLITHGVTIESLYNYENKYTYSYNNNYYLENYQNAAVNVFGTLRMIDGSVTDSFGAYGGVSVGAYGTLELFGAPVIKRNRGTNGVTEDVRLESQAVITVAGLLDEDADIGVYVPYLNIDPYESYVMTSGFDDYCHGMDPSLFFTIERMPSDLHYLSLNSDGEAAVCYHRHNFALQLTEGREDEVQFCCLNEDHCPLGGKVYTYRIHADDWAVGDGIPTRAYFSGSLPDSGEIDKVSVIRSGVPKYRDDDTGKLLSERPAQDGHYTVSQDIDYYYDNNFFGGTVTISTSYTIHTHEHSVPVTEDDSPSTCTEDGSYDVATYCTICSAELSREHVIIPAAHTYGDPEWSWSENNRTAQAAFICAECGHEETADAIVKGELDDGKLTCTATAEINGDTYTDTKVITDVQHFDRVEPSIDSSGAYVLGAKEHYLINGMNYAVCDNGTVGEELSDLSLSYFDFTDNGDSWQLLHYTGAYDGLDVLEIPATYQGKAITVIGDGGNHTGFMNASGEKKPFVLKLNGNIVEIRPYAFADTWVTEVAGDTSALSVIGDHAFADANSEGDGALTITLGYTGPVTVGSGAFDHLNVTAHIRHATAFDTTDTGQSSIAYVHTDAHIYGEPQWNWDNSYITATATFACTDDRCPHTVTVNATVTKEITETTLTHTASAELNGNRYQDTVTIHHTKTSYIDADGSEDLAQAVFLSSDSTVLTEGWYAVKSDLTISERIYCSGDVRLILCDGAELHAPKGINAAKEGGLYNGNVTIYGQKGGTGKLIIDDVDYNQAGIGSGSGSMEYAGLVTINGGVIDVTGGDNCAGIGGSYGRPGYVTINGGTITATGGDWNCPGIGGGSSVHPLNDTTVININGGNITAIGGIGMKYTDSSTNAVINLSWKNETDSILSDHYKGTVTLKKRFTDGTAMYPARTVSDNADLENKTLTPYEFGHVHTYGEPAWSWSSLYGVRSATATFTCTDETCQDSQSFGATVTERFEDNVGVYTAAVTFDGSIYTDVQRVSYYRVIPEIIGHGSITINRELALEGNGIYITAKTPDPGYVFANISATDANGNPIRINQGRSFSMPASDVTIRAEFVERTYNATCSGTDGSVTVSKDSGIHAGEEIEISPHPDEGYVLWKLYAVDTDGNTFDITNKTLQMPDSDVTIYARFAAITPSVAPYIDDSGAYHLGTVAYVNMDDRYYAVTDNGSVGEELDSLALSYFDFVLLDDGTYQIRHYTGPTGSDSVIDELVIPDTFEGRAITVLGCDDDSSSFVLDPVTIMMLKIGKNLTEIKQKTFFCNLIYKIAGDTSALRTIGDQAFGAILGADEDGVDITLTYPGTIDNQGFAFGSSNLTIHLPHTTKFRSDLLTEGQITLDFTDDHTYGSPVWNWSQDSRSATATFTCTDTRCKHEETVKTTVSKSEETSRTVYSASVEFRGETYTGKKEILKTLSYIVIADIANGTVTASKASAYEGEEVTLTVTPDPGYKLRSLTVTDGSDNEVMVNDNRYIMPGSDVTVSAVFEQKTHAITYNVENGWVTGVYSANYGDMVELTVTPYTGYEPDYFSVTDADQNEITVTDGRFTMPDSDVTVTAVFKKSDIAITYESDGNGTVTGPSTAQFNDEVPLTVTPNEGYALWSLYAEELEWNDPVNVIDGNLYMIDSPVTVYAEFVPIIPARAPYIDDSGEYHPGCIEHCEVDGYYYAVENGVVTKQLESVAVNDFEFIDLGSSYQISYYIGSTENLHEIVIPGSYNGKPITVLGNDINVASNAKCRVVPQGTPAFTLVLNENITEIKPYSFYAVQITSVEGDTSNLSKIGNYAFSWANSGHGYALDIKLDYPGKITVGAGVFNHMHVTAQLKHTTTFSKSSFGQQSISYVYTDAHTYGGPVWNWSQDSRSATATFTCTDSRCKHTETVVAAITRGVDDSKSIRIAEVEFQGNSYLDAKEIDFFPGHSLTLNGSIGVNFYLDLTAEEAASATIRFTWFDKELNNAEIILDPNGSGYYRASCPIAVAEMTYPITATVTIGDKTYTNTYSAVDYANVILTDLSFKTKFIAEKGEEKFNQLVLLVKSMLDCGAKAQIQFKRDENNLANKDLVDDDAESPYYYAPENVTADMIPTEATDMTDGLEAYGLEYTGSTLVYLSQTSLRHYYKIIDQTKFDSVKGNITMGGEKVDYTVKGSEIYFEVKNIAAAELDDLYTLKIGESEYKCSVLDYVRACLNSDMTTANMKELAKATYLYNQAANAYFD